MTIFDQVSAKSYGRCGDIVKSIAQAFSSGGSGGKKKGVVDDQPHNLEQVSRTALSFFREQDDSSTGVLSFVGFSLALEEMALVHERLSLSGEEMGR